MNALIELWEKPAPGKYMIAGWHQWADAGEVSSGLPEYLVDHTRAKKIGEIKPDSFYLFQIPGTHHLLRPVIKLDRGHRQALERRKNQIFYSPGDERSFFLFLGEEPHQNEEQYAQAFFDVAAALGVERIAAVAGVYGPVPYDRDRNISCVYSLPEMKDELTKYSVRFSDYEGGATISMYLADRAEARGIAFFRLCAFVPSYDFARPAPLVPTVAIERDFKAWYDVMIRLKHMFDLDVDLSDLEERSDDLVSAWDAKIDQMIKTTPQLAIKEYLTKIKSEFTEMSFEPLSNVWKEALGNILDDI